MSSKSVNEVKKVAETEFEALYKRDQQLKTIQARELKKEILKTYENINVTIPRVIEWFMESEECILNNHAERIPNSAAPKHTKEIIQPVDDWIDLHHC